MRATTLSSYELIQYKFKERPTATFRGSLPALKKERKLFGHRVCYCEAV